jgi:hypothetical protein
MEKQNDLVQIINQKGENRTNSKFSSWVKMPVNEDLKKLKN